MLGDVSDAHFDVGQIVRHRLFDYRGVIVDVDPSFQLTEEWYAQVARSQPPRDQPWYHVLPHGATHTTYVAQRNLKPDPEPSPVEHPLLDAYFSGYADGHYVATRELN